MPSYISHAIMAEQLYKEANNVFKTNINVEELKAYSLGADLSVLSKKVIKNPQNYSTRNFFLYLAKYIKENKMIDNSSVMALLYGHMAHYFFDINAHPLIYYLDYGCKKSSFISNHSLIEGYLNSYLVEKILNKDIMDINASYFNQISLNRVEISNLLNNVYGNIYNDYDIIDSYRKVIYLFTFLENVIKTNLFSKEVLINLSGFDLFLKNNNLSLEELVNINKSIYTNPITGEIHNESFLEIFYKSIDMTLCAIEIVNNYLYDGYSIDKLFDVFRDLSYDTGVSCSLGKDFVYVRNLSKNSLVNKKNYKKGLSL